MELEFHQITKKYARLRITSPGNHARLMASLSEEGQLHPVLVVESVGHAGGEYVLIDGYCRVAALEALARDTVKAQVLSLDEPDALIFRYSQESGRQRSALEEGWLLRELEEQQSWSRLELSRRFQRTQSWVSRRLSLVRELPQSAQDLVRRGHLSSGGAMKYLVPLSRDKKSDCEELVRNLRGRRTSVRELERIYASWKSGDAEQRSRVVSNPQLFLKTVEELKAHRGADVGDRIRDAASDLEILDAVSGRVRRRLRELERLPELLVSPWRAARSSFETLTRTVEEVQDAGL